MEQVMCFKIFHACVKAMHNAKLITPESPKDKEFHFQNWCEERIKETGLNYEVAGRNIYPDFRLVKYSEGYEIK